LCVYIATLNSKPEVQSLYCVNDEHEELPLPWQLKSTLSFPDFDTHIARAASELSATLSK